MTDDVAEPPMSDEDRDRTKVKICMTSCGYIDAMHTTLDSVRDGHDPRNAIDHNIEQAQIALEVASMRIQQAMHHIASRIPRQDTEESS